MTLEASAQIAGKIGFAGEQIISYLDEINRTPCPRCGENDLTVGIVGKNVVIRCSEALSDYNACEEDTVIPGLCGFVQTIRRTSLTEPPFTLKVGQDTKRGTAKNSKPPPRRRTRKTT